jgi:hypothetical protein
MRFREQWKLNSLMMRLANTLLEFSTDPAEHGIASLVFLGTPFYYKQWQSNWRLRTLEWIWNALGEALVAGVAAYVMLCIAGTLVALLPAVLWIGINPSGWPVWVSACLAVAVGLGAYSGGRRPLGSANTNVYFDETLFHEDTGSPLADLKGRRIFDALVVSSGYVDEALSGLSSFPLIGTLAPGLVDSVDAQAMDVCPGTESDWQSSLDHRRLRPALDEDIYPPDRRRHQIRRVPAAPCDLQALHPSSYDEPGRPFRVAIVLRAAG